MTRTARIVSLVGLLAVFTGCPDPNMPVAFTITVSPVIAPPPASTLPPGGVFSNVTWTGYLVRTQDDGEEVWTKTIGLTPVTIYQPLADFSYNDARVNDALYIIFQGNYVVPNMLDPTNPTVYAVRGTRAYTIQDAMNGGIPMTDFIPVHD